MTEKKVVIKLSNATTTEVAVESFTQTVLALKETVATALSIPVSQQRLIFRGKVLKDENSLEFYEIAEGLTIHLVKGAAKPAETTPTAAPVATPSAAPSATPFAPPAANPFAAQAPFPAFGANPYGAGMGGAGMGMGMGMDMNRMQEEMMRNPQMMQQIMNSPMMQGMLDNPEMLREIMLNNPQMQAMLDSNPHVRHVLNDPSVCSYFLLVFYTTFSFIYML